MKKPDGLEVFLRFNLNHKITVHIKMNIGNVLKEEYELIFKTALR